MIVLNLQLTFRFREVPHDRCIFGEREEGAMKSAKNTVIISKTDGPISMYLAGKIKPPVKTPEGCVKRKEVSVTIQ